MTKKHQRSSNCLGWEWGLGEGTKWKTFAIRRRCDLSFYVSFSNSENEL